MLQRLILVIIVVFAVPSLCAAQNSNSQAPAQQSRPQRTPPPAPAPAAQQGNANTQATAQQMSSAAKQLAQRGSGRGLISICAAGGMGVTAILER